MAEKTKVRLKLNVPIETLVPGRHTFIVPFDEGCAELIGEIVIYWGAFEVRMDALMSHVFDITGKRPNPNWRKQPFGERKKLFRKLMREYTSRMFPSLTKKFDEIMDVADDLQIKRNIVSHGYYQTAASPSDAAGVSKPVIIATGEKQKQFITINVETLGQLWHDISHLVGELIACVNEMGGVVDGNDIVLCDDDFIGLSETAEPKEFSFRRLVANSKKE